MLGCTLKEYIDCFDEKLANYLKAYEDNTPKSFLKNQLGLYSLYLSELNLISNELLINDEINDSEVFLKSSTYDRLKKIDITTYNDLLIEEIPIQGGDKFSISRDIYENKRFFLKVRIDHVKLRNFITSAEKIVAFIEIKIKIFEQENQHSKALTVDNLNDPSQIVTSILEEGVSTELKSNDFIDPHKRDKDKIDKYLTQFTDYLSTEDYFLLTNSLLEYFQNDKFPKLDRKITFKKINKKKVGWALKEVYYSFKTDKLNILILGFAVENINLFSKYKIPKGNLFRSNIYKLFTTNPKSYNYN